MSKQLVSSQLSAPHHQTSVFIVGAYLCGVHGQLPHLSEEKQGSLVRLIAVTLKSTCESALGQPRYILMMMIKRTHVFSFYCYIHCFISNTMWYSVLRTLSVGVYKNQMDYLIKYFMLCNRSRINEKGFLKVGEIILKLYCSILIVCFYFYWIFGELR